MNNTGKNDGDCPASVSVAEQAHPAAGKGRLGRNAERTRQRILLAARDLFAKGHYESVGTREIAASAGVNVTLINRYFGSKKKLFAAVVDSLDELAKALGTNARGALDKALDSIVLGGDRGNSTWVDEFRIILFSALNPEVTDIISAFFDRKRKALGEKLHGADVAARADSAYVLIRGSALLVSLSRSTKHGKKEMETFRKNLGHMLDQLLGPDRQETSR